jgi:hypothetical protein
VGFREAGNGNESLGSAGSVDKIKRLHRGAFSFFIPVGRPLSIQ